MTSDTTPEIAGLYRAMFDALSPGERIHRALEMYEFARRLARAGILMERPQATEAEIQQQLFLRFFGGDYTAVQKERILAFIARRFRTSSATVA